MRILHFTESLNEGGIASFLIGLSKSQAQYEEVGICTIFKNNCYKDILDNSSVIVSSLENPSSFWSYLYFPFLVAKTIINSGYDIIHIHCSFVYYILAILLCHKRKSFFYTIHSDAFQEKNSSTIESFFWPIKKLYFKKGWIKPITISQQSEDSFYRLYGFHAKIIVNGIPLQSVQDATFISHLRTNSNAKIYIHAGRISEAKNQVAMCRAFSRFILDGLDAYLIIAGSIQDKHIYSELKTFFNDRIIYIGQRNDVLSIFKAADFMLLPSKWEGMPISLLESMSQKCIPICSPVGGIVNIIEDNISGILMKDSTEESIYQSLRLSVKLSTQEIIQLREKCYSVVQNYSIEQTASDYLNYYKSAQQ